MSRQSPLYRLSVSRKFGIIELLLKVPKNSLKKGVPTLRVLKKVDMNKCTKRTTGQLYNYNTRKIYDRATKFAENVSYYSTQFV